MITINSLSNAYIIISTLNLKPKETGVLDESILVLSELKSIDNLCIRNLIEMSSADIIKVQNRIESFDNHGGSWGNISGDIDNQTDLKNKFENIELTKADREALEILVQLVNTKADQTYVVSEISRIVGAAPAALDTLYEIATQLGQDESQINNLLTLVGNCIRFDTNQTLTSGQKTQVLSNIGAASLAQGLKADTALQSNDVSTVALTGNYSDLSNKPSIPSAQVNSDWMSSTGITAILNKPSFATVSISGSYNDLLNKPLLSAVATSGSYNDLTNKPTIPSAQINSDWLSSSGLSQILNKPTLSLVATSGSYSDLSNKPVNATTSIDGFMSSSDKTKLDGLGNTALTHFVESLNNTAPNTAAFPTIMLTPSSARTETNINITVQPKGTGAFTLQNPTGTAVGGNKRGNYAVDLQLARANSSQICSGAYSFSTGVSNTVSGTYGFASGQQNTVTGSGVAQGSSNTVGSLGYAFGYLNTVANFGAAVLSGSYNQNNGMSSNDFDGSYNGSIIVGGMNNQIKLNSSGIIGTGYLNFINSGTHCAILSGESNQTNAKYSTILNGAYVTDRSIPSIHWNTGAPSATIGALQHGFYSIYASTTDATKKAITTNGSATSSNNTIALSNNTVYYMEGRVVAKSNNATADSAVWIFKCAVKKIATNSSLAFIGTPTITKVAEDSPTSTWVFNVELDTTNGYVILSGTGAASTNIRWIGHIETTEVTY